ISRMVRSALLEVLGQEYVRTARAKGLRGSVVLYRHALRNALLPVLTLVGLQFSFLLGGSVVQESLFNLPGLGRSLIDAINYRDYPVVQALVMVFALVILVVNLGVDLAYGGLDPRIRHGRSG